VGNKNDLEEDRVVSRESGQSLANKWSCSFLETSAKSRANVTEVKKKEFSKINLFLFYISKVFYDLIRQINRKIPTPRTHKSKIKYVEQPEPHVTIDEEYSTSQSKVLIQEKKSKCCILL